MEEANVGLQYGDTTKVDTGLALKPRSVNVLATVLTRLLKLANESEEDYEGSIIATQMHVYGMGRRKGFQGNYNYHQAELDPTYSSQVLEPFMERLRRNNKTPLVLDLGAGKGEASDYIEANGMKTVRVDISNSGLRGQRNAVQASSWKLPFSNGSVDGIHSKDMVTHIPPIFRDELFSELNRVMKPGGVVLLCSAEITRGNHYQYPTFKEDFINLAEKQGFTVRDTQEWNRSRQFKDWYTNMPRFVLVLRKQEVKK